MFKRKKTNHLETLFVTEAIQYLLMSRNFFLTRPADVKFLKKQQNVSDCF